MEDKDLMIVDGVRLEIDKEYWVKHHPSDGPWNKVKITRVTRHGHPWMVNAIANSNIPIAGIITDGSYHVQEITPEVELEQFARTWLNDKGYSGFANHTTIPKWFAEMYNDFPPKEEIFEK